MKIDYSRRFLKNYRKRIIPNPKLDIKFTERLNLFIVDQTHPEPHDHKLLGIWEGFRAFSVTGDVRVVYRLKDTDTVEFYDIGSHNQVY